MSGTQRCELKWRVLGAPESEREARSERLIAAGGDPMPEDDAFLQYVLSLVVARNKAGTAGKTAAKRARQ